MLRRGRKLILASLLTSLALFALLNLPKFCVVDMPQTPGSRAQFLAQPGKTTVANRASADALTYSANNRMQRGAVGSREEKQVKDMPEFNAEVVPKTRSVEPELKGSTLAATVARSPSKVVVMGKMQHEDTSWVHELPGWQNAVYCVDPDATASCSSGLRTRINKAKEAMPYLTYIIDHYSTLPDIIAFVHAHRSGWPAAWHNDAPDHDAVRMLSSIRLVTILERGYINLRCITNVGCPDEVRPFRSPPEEGRHAEHAYQHFYAHFFNTTLDEMKTSIGVVATPCCAQFAVSRAQVQQREREFYVRIQDFLVNTRYDDDTSGRVMEYMWHIIFGREAVHCENVYEVSLAIWRAY